MKSKVKISFKNMPKTYGQLCAAYMPRPLHDKVDFENALEIVDALAGFPLNQDQEDYLDIVSDQVARYEEQHHPINHTQTTVAQRLAYLLEQAGMTASDLGRLLSERSLGSKILRGDRELSKDHIRTLATHFKLDPSYFF